LGSARSEAPSRDIVLDMAADEGRSRASAFPGFDALATGADELVERLVQRRIELGISQRTVAARMGTSQPAVARLEAGRTDPRLSTLARYAAALDTSVDFAVGPSEEAAP
jgi:DNA-binding XRE family transcriptional regulator